MHKKENKKFNRDTADCLRVGMLSHSYTQRILTSSMPRLRFSHGAPALTSRSPTEQAQPANPADFTMASVIKCVCCCSFLFVLFLRCVLDLERCVLDDIFLWPSFGHNADAFSCNGSSKAFALKLVAVSLNFIPHCYFKKIDGQQLKLDFL